MGPVKGYKKRRKAEPNVSASGSSEEGSLDWWDIFSNRLLYHYYHLKGIRVSSRGASQVVEELEKILVLNNLLISLRNHPDISRFARGVGPISLLGGEYGGDRKMDDLKLLFRAYVTDALLNGSMDDKKVVKDGISAGIAGYDAEMRKSVRKAAAGLRLKREVAMSIARKEVNMSFHYGLKNVQDLPTMTVWCYKEKSNESAKEIRKMMKFNTTVATQLVEDITGEQPDMSEESIKVDDTKKDEDEDEAVEWLNLRSINKKKHTSHFL